MPAKNSYKMDDLPENIKIEVIKLFQGNGLGSRLALKLIVEKDHSNHPEVYVFDLSQILNDEKQEIAGVVEPNSDKIYAGLYHSLTKREQQVVSKVAQGSISTEIAENLYISVNTVKNHRRNIKKKLGLPDTVLYSKFLRWVQANINAR